MVILYGIYMVILYGNFIWYLYGNFAWFLFVHNHENIPTKRINHFETNEIPFGSKSREHCQYDHIRLNVEGSGIYYSKKLLDFLT